MYILRLQAAEKSALTDKTKADTIKQLLAVVDSFEMAKGQLKPESEGEKKIDGSYQVRNGPRRVERVASGECATTELHAAQKGRCLHHKHGI